MALVDHHQGAITLGQIADLVQRGNHSIHREDAVGDYDLLHRAIGIRLLQLRFQIGHVGVGVAVALRLGKAHAIDDRGMVERVGDDRIVLAEQRLEYTAVGIEAGSIQDGVVGAVELGDLPLESLVKILRAADEADRAHPVAMRVERGVSGLDDSRMGAEPQVVVRAEVEHLAGASFDGDLHTLWRCDDALALVEPGVLNVLQFLLEDWFQSAVHMRIGKLRVESFVRRC